MYALYCGKHWDAWLVRCAAEHEVRGWRAPRGSSGHEVMAAYTRDYLEHPQRYDAFSPGGSELLSLLEIPHVGGLMTRARQS